MLSVAAFQLHSIMPYTASTRRIAIVFVVFATTRDESFPKNRTAHSSEARFSAGLCPCLWARGYRSPTSCQRQRQPRPHRVRRHTALVAGATAKGERLRGWADHRRPGAGRRWSAQPLSRSPLAVAPATSAVCLRTRCGRGWRCRWQLVGLRYPLAQRHGQRPAEKRASEECAVRFLGNDSSRVVANTTKTMAILRVEAV